jgi:hypothetical protein
MKKIILTESEITKIVRKSIETKLNEDKFSVEPEVSRQPRERDIDSLFGKYTYHVPDDVIRYMRKNPALIVKRLLDIYGEDKLMNYVDMARNPKEMDMRLDNDSLRDELDEEEDFKDRLRNSLQNRGKKEQPTSPLDSLFSSEDELSEDHSGDPNDKYVVKKCTKKEGEPWAVWEGDVRVKGFKSKEDAQKYADKENEEQSLNEMFKRIVRKIK